jgi:monoamine oxidase
MTEQARLSVDVAVIGGGLSGLSAARALADAGREVVVLEARDRVGGRLLNATLGDGVTVDLGGQWVGSDHVRVQRLAGELGIEIFPQHGDGRNLLDVGGKRRRYRGTIPRLGPRVLWDIFVARRRFDRMARAVGAEAPWAAERAAELDRETLAEWCERNVRTEIARELIGLAGRTVWGTGPEELSMLHVLFYVAAAGSFDKLIDTEGGAQQDRLDGGAQLLPRGLAESLGERPGALTKCMALYEEPFWRADGLSGESVTDAGPVTLTFDSSPRDGSAGILLGFVGGPEARELAAMPVAERRAPVLTCFERLFGPRAARPLEYAEQTWAEEEWSGGGPTSNFGPGGWTGCGAALREPAGRVHWAGTETATVWSGYMEGALQAGERASAEVMLESGRPVS